MPALNYQPITVTRRLNNHPITFSIIVVYRNEIDALPTLLKSLSEQDYNPALLEIILVNDASIDGSQEFVNEFIKKNLSMHYIHFDRTPKSVSAKKDGITQAISRATQEHILLTDADCVVPKTWISAYSRHYQSYADASLVAGPVRLNGQGFLAGLQQLEMLALQTITTGAFALRQPFMCNGANLSFKKKAFEAVQGYLGNDHLSSGDDVFLLEKLAAEDVLQCHYLKNTQALISTSPKNSWKEMIEQRARWSRKSTETKSLLNKLVAFHVATASLLFVFAPLLYVFHLISIELMWSFYFLKFFTDFVVLVIGNQLYQVSSWMRYFILQFFMYPFIVIAIGLKSLGSIKWQDRSIDRPSH
ncbi:glycosyltransferase [Nonlabens marinus]|uniref:glycosyltransferase n=1 Tax=Nonlabens marinus TaxID=930802 RepID=UPI0006960A5B|nr:glycosyltransferase [Nonlabens marinus]